VSGYWDFRGTGFVSEELSEVTLHRINDGIGHVGSSNGLGLQ